MQGEKLHVYKTYDKIATWFAENRYSGLMEKNYLDDLISRLPAQASVLDLGCGTGVPILKYLIEQNINVTGVDASEKILGIAKANFPEAPFVLQDMRQLDLDKKFNAIIAWHSFFHLPVDDQPAMFKRFTNHLNTNGILLFTSGTEHGEAWGNIGGEDLFHGSLATAEYERLLRENDFEVLKHVVDDAECGRATVWMAKYIGK
jgi:cyclopropane fatty-acyl-phospholipid synthase-like methyltransferase